MVRKKKIRGRDQLIACQVLPPGLPEAVVQLISSRPALNFLFGCNENGGKVQHFLYVVVKRLEELEPEQLETSSAETGRLVAPWFVPVRRTREARM
eukprot:7099910-Prymnesium_polylepis.1